MNTLPMVNRTNAFWGLALALGFAFAWATPRIALFSDHAMMHDDYFMAIYPNVYDVFFIKEYRILGGALPTIIKFLNPNIYATNAPIYINALLMGLAGSLLFHFFMQLGRSRLIAGSVTLLFLFHPVLNDISAWNTMGFALLSALYVTLGFLLAWDIGRGKFLAATTLFFCSLATYQLMFPTPMVLTIILFVHNGSVSNHWEWKRALRVALAMLASLVLYLCYIRFISPIFFGSFGPSGLKSPLEVVANLRALLMQSTNLYLNLFYSPISHYVGISRGLGSWYYFPIAIVMSGCLIATIGLFKKKISVFRAIILLASWALLPLISVVPLWFIPFYTEWRISFGLLMTQIIVLASMAMAAHRFLGPSTYQSEEDGNSFKPKVFMAAMLALPFLAFSVALLPVTASDCEMRIADYRHDLRIVASIHKFRQSLPDPSLHRVAYKPLSRPILELNGSERPLMKANYLINTYSTFSYGKIWAYAIFKFQKIESIPIEEAEPLSRAEQLPEVDAEAQRFTKLPYVVHYRSQNLSIVMGSPQWYTWEVKK